MCCMYLSVFYHGQFDPQKGREKDRRDQIITGTENELKACDDEDVEERRTRIGKVGIIGRHKDAKKINKML